MYRLILTHFFPVAAAALAYFLFSLTPTNLALYHSYLNFLKTLFALNSLDITVAFSLFGVL